MKKILFILLLQCALQINKTFTLCTDEGCTDSVSQQIVARTNAFRASNGRGPLTWNNIITGVGKAYSMRMARGIVPFSHNGFDCRVSLMPKQARAAGENLYFDSGANVNNIAARAVNAFINSPGHRANLLGNYTFCGVGVFQNDAGVWYITMLLALF